MPLNYNPYGASGHLVQARSMGGGQSPGHITRNAYWAPKDPGNTSRDYNGRIVYAAPKNRSQPKPTPDPYLGLMEKAMAAMAPQKDPGYQNRLLDLLGGALGGGQPRKPQRPGGAAGSFGRYGGYPFGGGVKHDNIPGYIGQHQQPKTPDIQQFLPHWATDQAMRDIHAKGAVRGAPQTHMTGLAGARGMDYGSPMYSASATKNHMMQASQAARAAAETDFQDHLERSKFDIRHALAGNQDVIQGAQNQALRDAMMQQGNSQYFNQILSLIGGLA